MISILQKEYLSTVRNLLKAVDKCRSCPPLVKEIHCRHSLRLFQWQINPDRTLGPQIKVFCVGRIFNVKRDCSLPAAFSHIFCYLYTDTILFIYS